MMVNPHVHSSITRDHACCACDEGIAHTWHLWKRCDGRRLLSDNYRDSGASPGATKTLDWRHVPWPSALG